MPLHEAQMGKKCIEGPSDSSFAGIWHEVLGMPKLECAAASVCVLGFVVVVLAAARAREMEFLQIDLGKNLLSATICIVATLSTSFPS